MSEGLRELSQATFQAQGRIHYVSFPVNDSMHIVLYLREWVRPQLVRLDPLCFREHLIYRETISFRARRSYRENLKTISRAYKKLILLVAYKYQYARRHRLGFRHFSSSFRTPPRHPGYRQMSKRYHKDYVSAGALISRYSHTHYKHSRSLCN